MAVKKEPVAPAPVVSDKKKALETAMQQIEKMYGKGSIMRYGENAETNVEAIPTGSLALDLALGIGGVPRGRIIEIYGPESSGKTTLALHVLAEAQKMGGEVAFVDAEHALDPTYAKAILAIGRGGKKPRKDLATWKDAKDYMGFFYDEYLEKPVFDEKFSKAVIADVLNRFLESFDMTDDSTAWFNKVKAITETIGFTTDMKAYKLDPAAYPGTVADVSTFLRLAVTGKTNSPDLYTVMQLLGKERTESRIRSALAQLG